MEEGQENIEMVFNRFKELFTERCDRIPLLNLGEDSVRYDFFIALAEVEKLKPCDIQIEVPIRNSESIQYFIPRDNKKSKRKEQPKMDLVLDKGNIGFCAEFGLFRQNRNDKGNIDQTTKTMKMIEDMIRLGIYSYNNKLKAYFICVADDKMLRHHLQSRILGEFPSDYQISMEIIKKLMEKKTAAKEMNKEDFYGRFIKKFEEMKCSFQAKLLFNEEIKAEKINMETRIVIWEITKKETEQ